MTFLQELDQLIKSEPMLGLPVDSSCVNCEYNTFLYKSTNCYMCSGSSRLEDCYHLESCDQCKDSAEGYGNTECELCYECLDCKGCYNCDWCQDCINCSDLKFCFDCTGSRNCFGCVSLRNKEYYVFNQPYSKEEYEKMISEFDPSNPQHIEHFQKKFEKLKKTTPVPHMRGMANEDCSGDFISNSKNALYSFYVNGSEDVIYCHDEIYGDKDCIDCDHMHNSELCYNSMSVDKSHNINNSWWIINSSNIDYCLHLENCHDCFGCVNLKNKRYCILNEQYEKDEYLKKVEDIKQQMIADGEYGQYLPSTYPREDSVLAS